MRFSFLLLILILTQLFNTKKAGAEHIIGGEMYYECIGDGEYEVTLKMYRDCFSTGAQFDNPANVALYRVDGFLEQNITAPLTSQHNIDVSIESPCIAFPPDLCVEVGIYIFTIEVSDPAELYQMVYQRCCRNPSVINLLLPEQQGLTISTILAPAEDFGCNSSPYFNELPPVVLCNQTEFTFDHSATDPDGDSLAYSLCAPFTGGTQLDPMPVPATPPPYDEITWGTGFSAGNPIPGFPDFTIDPHTGFLSGTPIQEGQYVVGVCVEEWRDGQLVSRNVRDFQFNVAPCENVYQAIIAEPSTEDLCQGYTFHFNNLSDPDNDFIWNFGDETTTDDESTLYEPSYTYPDTGTYTVSLISNPGFTCSDTTYLELPIYHFADIDIQTPQSYCQEGELRYSFSAISNMPEGQVSWDFGPDAQFSSNDEPEVDWVVFPEGGEYQVQVLLLNNICTAADSITVTLPEPIQVEIQPQDTFCTGLHMAFGQNTENATDLFWDFGLPGDADTSNSNSPMFLYPAPGIYTVTLTASNPGSCPVTTTEVFDVQPLLDVNFPEQSIQCLEVNNFSFELNGSFAPTTDVTWFFEEANTPVVHGQTPGPVSWDSSGTYTVTVEASDFGCTREYHDNIYVQANPVADFEGINLSGCAPHRVSFENNSFSESGSVVYTWDFGDGHYANAINAGHTYDIPGTFTVSLKVENKTGCIDTDVMTKTAYVEIFPVPASGFIISPNPASLIDPVVEVKDESKGATTYRYIFENETVDGIPEFQYTLGILEPQTVVQIVENEFGCMSSSTVLLSIADHLIYVPNSFTPDEDGLNDLFIPVTTGAIALEMQIYDRWGKLIWETSEMGQGWNGESNLPGYYVENGMYLYKIRLTDTNKIPYEYSGVVHVLR